MWIETHDDGETIHVNGDVYAPAQMQRESFGLSVSRIWQLATENYVDSVYLGRVWYISCHDVDRYFLKRSELEVTLGREE